MLRYYVGVRYILLIAAGTFAAQQFKQQKVTLGTLTVIVSSVVMLNGCTVERLE